MPIVPSADTSPTSFVGREADLTRLSAVFGSTRLVSVLGPPGMGKTRLARRYAAAQAEARPAMTVVFCDLTEVTSAFGISSAVADGLGVSISSSACAKSAAQSLVSAIAACGALLVVLDNFEQLVAHAATTVGTWLGAAPEARFLVTSRERLGIAGEALVDLGPLTLPEGADVECSDAVRLFVARAGLVQQGYRLTAVDAPVVAELVRQLDGLPLAIELCAARLRVLSPKQILMNMARRFELLSAEARASVDPARAWRGAALWQTIESSWTQLSDPERGVLAACAVFRGGFDLEAVEALRGASDGATWTLDTLQRLVDKSLLRVEHVDRGAEPWTDASIPGPRFSMYLAIREFAAKMLGDSGVEADMIRRHAAHYLHSGAAWADRLQGPDAVAARWWLKREMENLSAVHARGLAFGRERERGALGPTAAIEAALAMSSLLVLSGPFALAVTLVEEALAAGGDAVPHDLLVRSLIVEGVSYRGLGRSADTLATLERARLVALEIGNESLLAQSLLQLGDSLVRNDDRRRGRELAEQAVAIFRKLGDRRRLGSALHWVGYAYACDQDHLNAERYYEEALEVHREVRDVVGEVQTLRYVARLALDRGDYEATRRSLTDALDLHRKLGDRNAEANVLAELACLEQDAGQLSEAKALYDAAVVKAREIGNLRGEALYIGCGGMCLVEQGRLAEARTALSEAIPGLDRASMRAYGALLRASLGALLADANELEAATSLFDEADARLALPNEENMMRAAVDLHRGHLELALARAAATSGDTVRASEHRASAQRRLQDASLLAGTTTEVRVAFRTLRRALDAEPSLSRGFGSEDFAADVLVIEHAGTWFRPPHGKRVELGHRTPLRALLAELLAHRQAQPGEPVPTSALLRRAWPEQPDRKAAVNRLRVAFSTLRKLGLGSALLSRNGGYLLDPDVHVDSPPV